MEAQVFTAALAYSSLFSDSAEQTALPSSGSFWNLNYSMKGADTPAVLNMNWQGTLENVLYSNIYAGQRTMLTLLHTPLTFQES